MGLKKQLGMGVASAALGLALVGGGTFAYFSDSVVSESEFVNGKINLQPEEPSMQNFHIVDFKPGDVLNATIPNQEPAMVLNNQGTLPFNAYMKVNVSSENPDGTSSDLEEKLIVSHLAFGKSNSSENLLDDVNAALGRPAGTPVTLADLEKATHQNEISVNGQTAKDGSGNALVGLFLNHMGLTYETGSIQSLTYKIEFPAKGQPQNGYQEDTTNVDITFIAMQEDGVTYDKDNLDNPGYSGGGGTWTNQ